MPTRYKVLQSPIGATLEAEEHGVRYFANCGFYEEIPPTFNRDGHYFDRLNKLIWYELGGRAFKARRFDFKEAKEYFDFDIAKNTNRRLTTREYEALKLLITEGIITWRANRQLWDLWYMENCIRSFRKTQVDIERYFLRNSKNE